MSRPRDLVICFGFGRDRRRRQPWHMAHGLATGLAANGREVILVTDVMAEDGAEADDPALAYRVRALPALLRRGRPSEALSALARAIRPERAYLFTGAFAIARLRLLDLGCPVELVVASPQLRLREILGIGPGDLWRERRLIALPLLNALLPGRLIARGFARSAAARPVYLSEASRERFRALGLPHGPLLVPQVDPWPCMAHPALARPKGDPLVAYLGPPLALRGAYLALEAFEAVVAMGFKARLLMLLRPDVAPGTMRRFLKRLNASPAAGHIEATTSMLEAAELARRLAAADVFLLPFQAPVSEVPLVVIEAGLTGRPVVTLAAPGVSEHARAMGGLIAKDAAELPQALIRALRQRHAATSIDTRRWSSWPAAVLAVLDEPKVPAIPYRLVAFCGVDGTGKSFLLQHLRQRLAASGIPSRHVWSRFRNYLSKPLLALARLTGHNYKVEEQGARTGYHDFAGRPWLALPFLALQVVDQLIDITCRYHLPRDILGAAPLILGDRSVYDTLVDLAVDTGLDDLVIDGIGPWLVRLLPRPHFVILIDRHPLRIQEQRPDALLDRHFHRRRALYRRLASRFGLASVDNNGPVARTLQAVEILIQHPPTQKQGPAPVSAAPGPRGEASDLRLL